MRKLCLVRINALYKTLGARHMIHHSPPTFAARRTSSTPRHDRRHSIQAGTDRFCLERDNALQKLPQKHMSRLLLQLPLSRTGHHLHHATTTGTLLQAGTVQFCLERINVMKKSIDAHHLVHHSSLTTAVDWTSSPPRHTHVHTDPNGHGQVLSAT